MKRKMVRKSKRVAKSWADMPMPKRMAFRKGVTLAKVKEKLGSRIHVVAMFPVMPDRALEDFIEKSLGGRVIASGVDVLTGVRDIEIETTAKRGLEGLRKIKSKLPSVRFSLRERI
jgi:hypothetical protein